MAPLVTPAASTISWTEVRSKPLSANSLVAWDSRRRGTESWSSAPAVTAVAGLRALARVISGPLLRLPSRGVLLLGAQHTDWLVSPLDLQPVACGVESVSVRQLSRGGGIGCGAVVRRAG